VGVEREAAVLGEKKMVPGAPVTVPVVSGAPFVVIVRVPTLPKLVVPLSVTAAVLNAPNGQHTAGNESR
jgi:hypothetical protein